MAVEIIGINREITNPSDRLQYEKLHLLNELEKYYPKARVGLLTYAAGVSNRICEDYLNVYTEFNLAYLKRYGYLDYSFEGGYYKITASETKIFDLIEEFLESKKI